MAGLPSDLYQRCRDVLLTCDEFESNEKLRTVFVVEKLFPYRAGLPQIDDITSRVDRCIDYLLSKRRKGEPVLAIFLEELRDRYAKVDSLYADLDQLVREVGKVLTSPISQESQHFLTERMRGKTNLDATPSTSQTSEISPAKSI